MKKEITNWEKIEKEFDEKFSEESGGCYYGKDQYGFENYLPEVALSDIKSFFRHQFQQQLDDFIFEVFIAKDGILPLMDIFIKPRKIGQIRKQLEKLK